MTLITAVVAGLAFGYLLGFTVRALVVFLVVWVIVLFVQTTFVLDNADVPPEAWEYVPVQIVILAVGVGLLWVGAWLRRRINVPRRA